MIRDLFFPSIEESVALNSLGLSLVRTDLRICLVPNKKGISTTQLKLILLFLKSGGKVPSLSRAPWNQALRSLRERVLLLMFSTVPSHSLTSFRNTVVFAVVKIILNINLWWKNKQRIQRYSCDSVMWSPY